MKYYVNKFLWLLLIIATLPLLSYGLHQTLGAIFGIPYEVFVIVCIVFYVGIIIKTKSQNSEKQKQYFQTKESKPSKIKLIFKGKELWSEVIIFLILLTPLVIKTLLDQNLCFPFEFLFVLCFTVIILGSLYGFLSFFILLMVYSKWEKQN